MKKLGTRSAGSVRQSRNLLKSMGLIFAWIVCLAIESARMYGRDGVQKMLQNSSQEQDQSSKRVVIEEDYATKARLYYGDDQY